MEFKQGIFDDVDGKMIRGVEAWSKSSLDKVNRSMAHYFEYKKNPAPATDSMNIGNALHCMVLTPDRFDETIAISPSCQKRSKEDKATWEAFLSENKGKPHIKPSDLEDVKHMSDAVMSHPIASEIITEGSPEQSIFWNDPHTGMKCKAKIDWIRKDGILVELKKTTDASLDYFQRKIFEFRYHVQGSFYLNGYSQIKNTFCKEFYFVVAEDKAPWNIAVYKLGPKTLDAGYAEYIANLTTVKKYFESEQEDRWAGYKLGTPTIEMPFWALQKSMKAGD